MDNSNYRILFVCHGNICRSPMAEFVMKELVRREGLSGSIFIDSAAVSYEEEGNGVYPPARKTLSAHGIPFGEHFAHRLDDEEASSFDLIIIMDSSNRRLISRIISSENLKKVHMMMEYAPGERVRDVSDPWYTGDFESTYRDIVDGCKGLLAQLIR
jgi:Protein-tyrosine-phosphatase